MTKALLRSVLPALALMLAFAVVPAVPTPDAQAGPGVSKRARGAALLHSLKTKRIKNAKFKEVGLRDFLKWVRTATGYNIVIRHQALAKAGIDPDDVVFTAELEDVSVHTLLMLALEPHDLAYVVKGNLILVTTHADSLGKPVTRLYPISHITYTKTDFIAPDINLRPSNWTPIDEYEPERPVENDPLDSGDAVAELVQELVQPDQWENEGWSIRATERYLVVRVPRSVHLEVARALRVISSLK